MEVLFEASYALESVKRGLVRDNAWKAFHEWKVLAVASLRLEMERLETAAKSKEERRWLEEGSCGEYLRA